MSWIHYCYSFEKKKEKKILTINCSELSRHTSSCLLFKSLQSPITEHCSTWEHPLLLCFLGNENLDGLNDVFRVLERGGGMAGIGTHGSNFLGCAVFLLPRRICGRLSTPPSPGIHEYHPEGLLKTLIAGPSPRASDSVGLGYGLRMYISNKFLEMLLLLTAEHPLRTTA